MSDKCIDQQPVPEKLWNPNFLLLWFGQLVSAIGDNFYAIALGFWILVETGSTALMGSLMAASVLPRILISPFAGVIVDRVNRKWILVLMDAIRGVCIVFLGIAAFSGFIRIWMVFAAGILLGACSAFFNPAVSSSVPDIVPKKMLVKANSVFSLVQTGSGIIGNAGGGFLYQLLAAPLMFLVNGISYIGSAISEVFIKIPVVHHNVERPHFFEDMKSGYRFVWKFSVLRYLILLASILNFLATMGFILVLPLFQQTESLGPGRYGLIMAFVTAGLTAGYLLGTIVDIKPEQRYKVFIVSGIMMPVLLAIFPLLKILFIMAVVAFLAGIGNALINVFINSTLQLTVPQDKRGKVFSLLNSVSMGLTPLAMALGGVLAEFIPVRLLISGSFVLCLFFFLPLMFMRGFRDFITFDPEKKNLESLLEQQAYNGT